MLPTLELLSSSEQFDINAFFGRFRSGHDSAPLDHRFGRAVEALNKYLDTIAAEKADDYRQRQHEAVIGDQAAKAFFMDKIGEFLRAFPDYANITYPDFYKSLPDALFQSTLGFGPMCNWFDDPSEAAQINGTAILFERNGEMELQPFSFDSLATVERLIRSITMTRAEAQISALDPTLDTDMLDGTRVSILKPPFVREPVITFRQYPMDTFTFEEEARRRTIPTEAIRWFHTMSGLMLNEAVTGPVGSGKSTLLKVIFGARDAHHTVVTVERDHYEINLKRDFPERRARIIEGKLSLEDMRVIFPRLLRVDARYIIVPEVRSDEVELLNLSAERGNGYLATYHSSHVVNIPQELATLSLNAYPQRRYSSEYERTAKNLDLVITINKTDGQRRVVTGVYAFSYDQEHAQLEVTPWMQFDATKDRWDFNAVIPKTLDDRLRKATSHSLAQKYQDFLTEFQKLQSLFPMEDATVQVKHLFREGMI